MSRRHFEMSSMVYSIVMFALAIVPCSAQAYDSIFTVASENVDIKVHCDQTVKGKTLVIFRNKSDRRVYFNYYVAGKQSKRDVLTNALVSIGPGRSCPIDMPEGIKASDIVLVFVRVGRDDGPFLDRKKGGA